MDSKLIEVYAVEEIDIDRQYNKKGKKRQTHLEIIGVGGILCSTQWASPRNT